MLSRYQQLYVQGKALLKLNNESCIWKKINESFFLRLLRPKYSSTIFFFPNLCAFDSKNTKFLKNSISSQAYSVLRHAFFSMYHLMSGLEPTAIRPIRGIRACIYCSRVLNSVLHKSEPLGLNETLDNFDPCLLKFQEKRSRIML